MKWLRICGGSSPRSATSKMEGALWKAVNYYITKRSILDVAAPLEPPLRIHIKSIENSMKKQTCLLVKKCLTNNICENFDSYFTLNLNEKKTRNNGILLKLSKIRLEFEKKSVYFQGAFLFNSLPQSIWNFEDFDDFKCALNSYFNIYLIFNIYYTNY